MHMFLINTMGRRFASTDTVDFQVFRGQHP